jgi:hypothetical protein
MPYYVRLPDNRDIEFPDNYPRDDAVRIAREMFRQPVEQPAVVAPPEERSLLGGAISRGYNTLQSSLGSAAEGAGSVLGIEGLRNYGAESRRRNQQEAEQAQPADRRATFENASTFGDYARATGQAVAESLPSTGLGLAGGIAGGAVGSLLGPVGTAAGAIGGRTLGAFLGSSLASLPTFYGSNRQRQIEESTPRDAEGRPTGEGTVSSEGAAFGTAAPQAALEGITDVLLGRLGRFFRGGTEEVGKSFLPRVAQGIGVGAASEVPTEVLQQALERAQAGLDLQSPEAYREYREATIAAIAAGGTMGGAVSGALGRRPVPATAREREEEAPPPPGQTPAPEAVAENASVETPAVQPPEAAVPNGNEVPTGGGITPEAAAPITAPAPAQVPEQAAPEIVDGQPKAQTAEPSAAPVAPPVAPVEPAPITGFTTALGSTYEINEEGQTSRTKNSPGRGQGQTYEPHNVLFVDPTESESILDDMRGGGTYRFVIDDPAGPRPIGVGESIAGKKSALAVFNQDGTFDRYVPAQTQPAVGLAPIELRYDTNEAGEVMSNRHIGNVITEVRGAAPAEQSAPVQPEPAASAQPMAVAEGETRKAIWNGPDYDMPVEVYPDPPEAAPDGTLYSRVSYGGQDTYLPTNDLKFREPAPVEEATKKAAATSQPVSVYSEVKRGKDIFPPGNKPAKAGAPKAKTKPAVAKGATGGLPPIGQRVPPMTNIMADGTEMRIEYNVVAKALSKRFGRYIQPAKFERFFTVFQDNMLPVARMVDDINATGGNVSQAMNTYVQQDLLSGRTADLLKQRNEGLYQRLINGIANSKVGMTDFENYLYARHAEERNNYIATINPEMPDGGSGMSNARAKEVLDEFAGAGKIPELEKLAVMFDAIIADTNKLRSEYGLTPDFSTMTVDSEGKLLPNYKNYAPLKGFADESVDADEPINEFRPKGSRMLGAKGREDMQAMGRKRMAGDIVAHAMMQNTQAVVRSQKNAVGQSFLEMLRANPEQTKDIAQILSRPMTRTAIVNGVVKVVPDIMYKGRPDILVVKEGGKETVVQIKDEAIARSMIGATSSSPTTNSALIKGMIALNSYLAKINTAYNPEFMITNFLRDLQTFGVNVEQFDVDGLRSDSIRDVRAAMSGIRDVVRGTDNNPEMAGYYNRLKELGGTNEAYGFADLDTRINEINETMAKAGTNAKSWKDMAKVIAPVGKFIEDYNTIVENGIRTSVFKNMVERGINEQQAAYIAKNVTVNFTKGGENRVFMNAMYLFYNASLQGTMAMVNAMGRSKKVRRIVAGIMVAGLMQDALNSMLSGEDEDGEKVYDKIPDHILKRSFIMMDPFGLTERGYLSFPMPYGFNAFFNMGREMSKVARGASSPMDGAGNILGTFVDAFNPVGGSNSFFNFVAPTIADPLVDIARNRDFADRPIVPERGGFGIQPPESQKYWNNTFAPFVGISSFLNEVTGGTTVIPGAVDISPNMINYLFNFATGAAGKFVERSFTTATTTIPSMLAGDFSEVEARELPLARSLIGNVTSRNDMERYMQRTQEVLQIRQEIRAANEAGDSERVAAAFERYPGQIEIMDSINKLARDRSKLTRDINSISRNENIPEDVKRDLIKQLRDQQNQLVGLANRLYNQRVTNRD